MAARWDLAWPRKRRLLPLRTSACPRMRASSPNSGSGAPIRPLSPPVWALTKSPDPRRLGPRPPQSRCHADLMEIVEDRTTTPPSAGHRRSCRWMKCRTTSSRRTHLADAIGSTASSTMPMADRPRRALHAKGQPKISTPAAIAQATSKEHGTATLRSNSTPGPWVARFGSERAGRFPSDQWPLSPPRNARQGPRAARPPGAVLRQRWENLLRYRSKCFLFTLGDISLGVGYFAAHIAGGFGAINTAADE